MYAALRVAADRTSPQRAEHARRGPRIVPVRPAACILASGAHARSPTDRHCLRRVDALDHWCSRAGTSAPRHARGRHDSRHLRFALHGHAGPRRSPAGARPGSRHMAHRRATSRAVLGGSRCWDLRVRRDGSLHRPPGTLHDRSHVEPTGDRCAVDGVAGRRVCGAHVVRERGPALRSVNETGPSTARDDSRPRRRRWGLTDRHAGVCPEHHR